MTEDIIGVVARKDAQPGNKLREAALTPPPSLSPTPPITPILSPPPPRTTTTATLLRSPWRPPRPQSQQSHPWTSVPRTDLWSWPGSSAGCATWGPLSWTGRPSWAPRGAPMLTWSSPCLSEKRTSSYLVTSGTCPSTQWRSRGTDRVVPVPDESKQLTKWVTLIKIWR